MTALPSEVRQTDCVAGMRSFPPGEARLVLGDPPYNLGVNYDSCGDNLPYDQYLAWTREWVEAATHALAPDGSLWIFLPEEWVSEVDVMCRREFGYTKRRHITWHFTFGQAAQRNFTKSCCHVLYLTRSKTDFVFNDGAIRVPSARQLRYNDKRANPKGKLPDATWMILREQLEPYLTPDADAWLESRVCGTYNERHAHVPNQIPLPILERIVRVATEPGDLVVDAFAGTAGLGVACKRLDRGYVGFDLSPVAVELGNARLAATAPAEEASPRTGATSQPE